MCGGTLEFAPGDTVATCEYCGTKQTLPRLDDDKRANLYDRAGHFRRNNEFDKAAGIYEQILSEDSTDAEAYWSLVLCRYGIEYVEDPRTHKHIPTVNRAQYTSIFDDEDYKSAIANADAAQREVYETEAKTINEIQKGILAISQKEDPFDVFICYKETDENGRRTPDSVLANDLYHQLMGEGFKVFFARITLEDKLGSAYEPYIFAALNSAKVMVVLGTKPAYFNAVWVKNEWSRYLALIKGGAKKILIPAYKDMDPYDLPEEFSHLQAQDMSKLGFMQDLIRGIKKLTGSDAPKTATVVKETVVTGANASTAPLLKRAFMFLEDGNWQEADAYCEKVLDLDPECAEAYLGKLMAECKVKKQEDLADLAEPFDGNNNYQKAVRFGNEKLASTLKGYIDHINARNEEARLADIYKRAKDLMKFEWISDHYSHAAELFNSIPGYKDADALAEQCAEKVATAYMEDIYDRAQHEWRIGNYEAAIDAFKSISGFCDADEQQHLCERAYAEKQAADEARAKKVNKALAIFGVLAVVVIVFTILYVTLISPALKRSKANQMLAAGDYADAYAILHELGDDEVIIENKRSRAEACLEQEKYNDAYKLFKDIGDEKAISESKYNRAIALLSAEQYDEAYALLNEVGKDEMISESRYNRAIALLDAEQYDEAYTLLNEVGKDEMISESMYNRAVRYLDAGDMQSAYMLFSLANYKDSVQRASEALYIMQKDNLKNIAVGQIVKFGAYEQDNNVNNGKEEIEWRVLAVEKQSALLISEYALDCVPYNNSREPITWENCTLRFWLNDTFYNEAFAQKQQKVIKTTAVSADKNPKYSTDPGNATTDKVFLLSINEVNKNFSSDEARKCIPTAYAKSSGVWTSGSYTKDRNATCCWWLRSLGYVQTFAADVSADGSVGLYGVRVEQNSYGIRPTIWVDYVD